MSLWLRGIKIPSGSSGFQRFWSCSLSRSFNFNGQFGNGCHFLHEYFGSNDFDDFGSGSSWISHQVNDGHSVVRSGSFGCNNHSIVTFFATASFGDFYQNLSNAGEGFSANCRIFGNEHFSITVGISLRFSLIVALPFDMVNQADHLILQFMDQAIGSTVAMFPNSNTEFFTPVGIFPFFRGFRCQISNKYTITFGHVSRCLRLKAPNLFGKIFLKPGDLLFQWFNTSELSMHGNCHIHTDMWTNDIKLGLTSNHAAEKLSEQFFHHIIPLSFVASDHYWRKSWKWKYDIKKACIVKLKVWYIICQYM